MPNGAFCGERNTPWMGRKPMDERLKFIARLLDGEKMAPLCREFGISRKTGDKTLGRYNGINPEAILPTARGGLPPRQRAARPKSRR